MSIEPTYKNCSRRNKPKQCKRKPGEYICLNWSGDFKVIRQQERAVPSNAKADKAVRMAAKQIC